MHLPVGTQYFCICSNEADLIDFYAAVDSVFANFGIKIIMQQISFDACVDLIKVENDRNFVILLRTDNPNFRSVALKTFKKLFEKSDCNHKFDLIDDVRQIYFTLLSSLNLALVFTGDGVLKTFGVQVVDQREDSGIKSNLIASSNIEPVPIEIINIQPIILDMTRCGVLEPVLYFVARDFGTCIAQVLLPNSTTWSVAYLIQCDDSGRNDLDMVKVCLVVNETNTETVEEKEKEEQKDLSVLNNQNYPLCRAISFFLYDLKNLPSTLNVITPLIKTISDALAFATADNPEIFPDADGLLQVKRKYSKLFNEITNELLKITDYRKKELGDTIKNLRRAINFINVDIKVLAQKTAKPTKWFDDARSYANPDSRYWGDTLKIKRKRLESEQKDGIITMPLLEPYLELKWPQKLPSKPEEYPLPEFHEYAKALIIKERDLLNNKRFGV